MQNNDSGDPNAKDTAALLSEWKKDYFIIFEDVKASLKKLDDIKAELEESRTIFKNSWRYCLKKFFLNTPYVGCVLGIVFIGGLVYWLTTSNIKINFHEKTIEITQNHNPSSTS